MKKLVVAAALAACTSCTVTTARAQSTAPDFPAPATAAAPRSAAKLPVDADRARRQAQMSPEEAARDQQMQIMEARTGNTSFGMARRGAYQPQDKANGAFTVRKFRELRGQEQQKGTTRRVQMGARTTGQPLNHKKHKFLFF